MSETTEKAPKAKVNGNGMTPDENEMAMALALFRSIPVSERKGAVIEAQMSHLGHEAYKFLSDGYHKLTGEKLPSIIILDGETGIFEDAEDDTDEDEDEDEEYDDEDEDAIDAVSGEDDEDDSEKPMTGKQAVRALKRYMKERGYSQAFIASKLKVSQPCVSTWLDGSSLPREGNIKRIARLVNA